jgi:hypothetical protein
MRLKPFFCYFGGKWRTAQRYPAPVFDTIIEPFAGGAGYALTYADRDVVLVERDPVIAALWRWLVAADRAEIEALPLAEDMTSFDVSVLDIRDEAKHLIGFWLNKGTASPCRTPSAWMRDGWRPNSFWSETIRARIAEQVEHISHWEVVEGSYESAPLLSATYFVDPPYENAGKHYRCGSKDIDFAALGRWCERLPGQSIICENEGASWLPFFSFGSFKSTQGAKRSGVSREVIYYNDETLA